MRFDFIVATLAVIHMIAIPHNVNALSFSENTEFLEASTYEECKKLGGEFIEWARETSCTKKKSAINNVTKDISATSPSKQKNIEQPNHYKSY